jgi:hypothetical protein
MREFDRFIVLPTGVDPVEGEDTPQFPTQSEAWAYAHPTAQETEKPHRVYGIDDGEVVLVGETMWHIMDIAV